MQCKFLLSRFLFLCTLILSFPVFSESSSTLTVATTSSVKHGLDFSQIKGGPLAIERFTDQRECLAVTCEKHSVIDSNNIPIKFNNELAAIAQDIVSHSFKNGNAMLAAPETSQLILNGVLTNASADGSTVVINLELSLSKNQRTVWQNTYRGKATAPSNQVTGEVINTAFDKVVEELMYDDYFVMELID